jgi:hypothetical protein
MAFIEIVAGRDGISSTEPVRADAFLIALQMQPCTDFDLYADGRLIRPCEFDAGAVAIFDLRTNLAMDRRDPFHAVDLYLPIKSLAAVAEDASSPAIDDLRHEPGRAIDDPVARHLLLAIRSALSAPDQARELFVDHVAIALAHAHCADLWRYACEAGIEYREVGTLAGAPREGTDRCQSQREQHAGRAGEGVRALDSTFHACIPMFDRHVAACLAASHVHGKGEASPCELSTLLADIALDAVSPIRAT